MSDEVFTRDLCSWLDANLPASLCTAMPEDEIPWGGSRGRFPNPDTRRWMDAMAARGWTAPTWPRMYGGGGLDATRAAILQQELRRRGARPALFSFGLWMLGPVLLEYGSEAQKQRFLPPIVRGEARWCQGYSEPDAGSDLASLRTKAVDAGDHWRVDGRKIWTSYADEADWIFCLVRTDTGRKHGGISFLLIDMKSPGVSTRPIRLISGSSPFCETFFDDVAVPKEHLVGPLNGGWEIARKLLQYERQNVAAAGFGGELKRIEARARQLFGIDAQGRIADAALRERIAHADMYEYATRLTMQRAQREVDAGQASSASSVVKYAAAHANQQHYELMIETLGYEGLGWQGAPYEAENLEQTRKWLRSKGNSIEGGTSEINLNVIARRVLGLPGGA